MELYGPTAEADWALCLDSHGPNKELFVPLDPVESRVYCNLCRFVSFWKMLLFFVRYCTVPPYSGIYLCSRTSRCAQGQWYFRSVIMWTILSSITAGTKEDEKTKMCNKGRESACLAANWWVGPSDATCSECLVSVCACMVGCKASEGKAQVVLGHTLSPPMTRRQMMWGVFWYLLSRQEELSVLQKFFSAVLGRVHWFNFQLVMFMK